MTIAHVNGTTDSTVAGATSVNPSFPSGASIGDLALWTLGCSAASPSAPSTPAGWSVWEAWFNTSTSPNSGIVVWYRIVDGSESGSYSKTGLTSGRWASLIDLYSGVDTTTPQDVANTTANLGSGQPTHASITPATAGAWVLGWESDTTPSGNTSMTYTSSNLTVDNQISSLAGGATNCLLGLGSVPWVSGAVVPVMTPNGGTPPRGVAISSVLRPLVATPISDPLIHPVRRLTPILVR